MTAVPLPGPGGLRGIGEVLKGLGALFAAKSMSDAADKVKDKTQEADCADTPDATQCNQCKLGDGFIAPAKARRNIAKNNIVNYHYQIYIANLHAAPERFAFCRNGTSEPLTHFDFSIASSVGRFLMGEEQITPEQLNILEWHFNSVEFDGFWRSKCTVVDAKGRYARHIAENGKPKRGFPEKFMFPEFSAEMGRQKGAIAPALPQAKLEWHFMEEPVYLLAIEGLGLDPSVCRHTPYFPVAKA